MHRNEYDVSGREDVHVRTSRPKLGILGVVPDGNGIEAQSVCDFGKIVSLFDDVRSHCLEPGWGCRLLDQSWRLDAVTKQSPSIDEIHANERGRQVQEPQMDVRATLIANHEAPVPMQPRKASFHDPPIAPQALARLDAAPRDAGHDSTKTAYRPSPCRVIRLVGMELLGSAAAAPSRRCQRRYSKEISNQDIKHRQ